MNTIMQQQTTGDIEGRLLDFIHKNTDGKLQIITGFASVWGLAWLARNTQHRSVELCIGKIDRRYFRNSTEAERNEAEAFLNRDNVLVKTGRDKPEDHGYIHMKTWRIQSGRETRVVLSGSANLSKNGLRQNREIMSSVPAEELPAVSEQINSVLREARSCKQDLMKNVKHPFGKGLATATRYLESVRPNVLKPKPPEQEALDEPEETEAEINAVKSLSAGLTTFLSGLAVIFIVGLAEIIPALAQDWLTIFLSTSPFIAPFVAALGYYYGIKARKCYASDTPKYVKYFVKYGAIILAVGLAINSGLIVAILI